MKIISGMISKKDADGKVVSTWTAYYKWTRDGVPVWASKREAAVFDDQVAEVVFRQVSRLTNRACRLVDLQD